MYHQHVCDVTSRLTFEGTFILIDNHLTLRLHFILESIFFSIDFMKFFFSKVAIHLELSPLIYEFTFPNRICHRATKVQKIPKINLDVI